MKNCTSHDNGDDGILIEGPDQSVEMSNVATYRNGGKGVNIKNK
jgi:hypothetical protein